MIEFLSGTVLTRLPHSLIINVQGVGYGVEMPLSSICDAPLPGEPISVWVDTYVREDALRLFGFSTFEDRQAFLMLRSVSGIGPKIALAVLSTLDARAIRQTILQNKISVLESVPGIGRRTAERLILELKPKMEKLSFAAPAISFSKPNGASRQSIKEQTDDIDGFEINADRFDAIIMDVRSALENLGYKDKDINPVMSTLLRKTELHQPMEFQNILKGALKSIRESM
jgi:holliday junction DNA helicase RuvA